MTSDQSEATIKKYFQLYDCQLLEPLLDLTTEAIRVEIAGMIQLRGRASYAAYLRDSWRNYGRAKSEIIRTTLDTSGAFVEGIWHATMTGDSVFPNGQIVPATQRTTSLSFVFSFDLVDGKISAIRTYWNSLKAMLDFGIPLHLVQGFGHS